MNRIAIWGILAFALGSCLQPAVAQSTNITGDWDITVNSPQGARTFRGSLKADGEKLTGTIQAPGGAGLQLEGSVTGKNLKFTYKVSFQGNELPITMTGTVDGDSMKGEADFGGFAQGDWSAKRATGAAPSGAPAAASSGGAGNATGEWEVTIVAPTGESKSQATFMQEGEKLSGVLKNPQGQLPIQGTVKGKEVKVVFTVNFQGNPMEITLTGNLEGDSIKGGADFGGLAPGDWSASRTSRTPAAIASVPAQAASPGALDLTGTWQFEVETSAGSGSPTFTFKQDGEKLTGHYKGTFGEADLTGSVKGNAVTFSLKVSGQGVEGTITYTGTITDKSSMKGTATLAELGTANWTAKRQ